MSDEKGSLDEVRARLRDLGYLRGPLSGLTGWIVSGRIGAGGASPFPRISLAAGLRLAVIGGPILGGAAAALIALTNRPHFSSPGDLALLALYLSVVFGLVLWGLELLTDSILARLASRGLVLVGGFEKAAGRVGLLFSLATTLYL
ncbi:MAG TPA: hypothetical protein VFG76_12525, partial [Candidatus Polarisedimenticolia bacterium]|nr:hypothetical protein [Candidatus Polarisedimenticolia bacterium]